MEPAFGFEPIEPFRSPESYLSPGGHPDFTVFSSQMHMDGGFGEGNNFPGMEPAFSFEPIEPFRSPEPCLSPDGFSSQMDHNLSRGHFKKTRTELDTILDERHGPSLLTTSRERLVYSKGPTTFDALELYKVSRIPCRSKSKEIRIRAYLNLISVLAFPDTCSGLNVLSESFVQHHGFALDKDTGHSVRLPDGTRVKPIGSLTLPMRYDGEMKSYSLSFVVLHNCVHDVVLGNPFLRMTETFTKFLHRIEWLPRGSAQLMPRVCFVDTPQQRVEGSMNGHFVSASPDTGSEVNLISKDFATALDLKINTDPTQIITLEFIDGSTAHTYGVIPEVEWRFDEDEDSTQQASQHRSTSASKPKMVQEWDFGSDASPQGTYICDFYVLEQLTSSIILSSDLLLGLNAFAACGKNFSEMIVWRKHRVEEVSVSYIREKKSKKKAQRSWREVIFRQPANNNDPLPAPAPVTAAQAWQTELRRRGDEADRIAELPPDERVTAQEAENQRIHRWEVNQVLQQNTQTPAQQSTSGSQAQPQSTNSQSGLTSP